MPIPKTKWIDYLRQTFFSDIFSCDLQRQAIWNVNVNQSHLSKWHLKTHSAKSPPFIKLIFFSFSTINTRRLNFNITQNSVIHWPELFGMICFSNTSQERPSSAESVQVRLSPHKARQWNSHQKPKIKLT